MRVWVDITTAADVVFFAPVVRRLEAGGHVVTVTARRFAQADALLRRYGLGAVLAGRHKGGGAAARTVGLANRTRQLVSSAAAGRYDVATGTHSTDFVLAAWTLGLRQLTFPEDEDLRDVTHMSMRFADEVAVPDALTKEFLVAFRPAPRRFVRFPGFREEYYLHDLQPDPAVLLRLGVDARRIVGVVRPPRQRTGDDDAERREAALAAQIEVLVRRRNVTLILLARDDEQRLRLLRRIPGLVAPATAVDGVGLIAAADFVLGDAGIMLREAVALGTPAYALPRTRLTAVDRVLLGCGRLNVARDGDDVVLRKRHVRALPLEPRDPQIFVDELLELGRPGSAGRKPGGWSGIRRAIR